MPKIKIGHCEKTANEKDSATPADYKTQNKIQLAVPENMEYTALGTRHRFSRYISKLYGDSGETVSRLLAYISYLLFGLVPVSLIYAAVRILSLAVLLLSAEDKSAVNIGYYLSRSAAGATLAGMLAVAALILIAFTKIIDNTGTKKQPVIRVKICKKARAIRP